MRRIVVPLADGRKAVYQQVIKPYDVNLTVPDDGNTYIMYLHDHQKPKEYKPRQIVNRWGKGGVPEVANDVIRRGPDPEMNYEIRDYDYVKINREIQVFIRDFFRASLDDILPLGEFVRYYRRLRPEYPFDSSSTFSEFTAGSLLAYWESIMARHVYATDDRPPEDWRDDITGRNSDKDWFSFLFKGFGGMMLRAHDIGSRWRVDAIDVLQPLPDPWDVFHNKPWLYCWATETTDTRLSNLSYVVSSFSKADAQLSVEGLGRTGVAIPILSRGGYWDIKKEHAVKLVPGSKYSAYNPPR